MIAAIYARKSTKQDVDADAKSVTRQIDNARAFAASKGWTVLDEWVFADDGVSGAETHKLLQKQAMLDAALNKQFDVVVMQAPDRFSRRDGHLAFAELEQLARHVAIWFYAKGEQFTSGDFKSNVTGILESEFAAEFRRNIASKTLESLIRRAEQGYATGGKVFGYDNVRVRDHVERRVNDREADVVRDIFQRYAAGEGFKTIAHALNAQHQPSPRPQHGRPAGWDPGTVRSVLRRSIYRGTVSYNKTKKRDKDGSRHRGRQPKKPEAAWLKIDKPELCLIDKKIAALVDERLKGRREAYLRDAKGHLLGSPKRHGHGKVSHLLAGFMVCTCGATFEAVRGLYVCSARRRKGPSVCPSDLTFNIESVDQTFLDRLEEAMFAPTFIDHVLDVAFAHDPGAERAALVQERDRVGREIENLTKGIAAGGDIPALADALKERDTRLKSVQARLAKPVLMPDRDVLKAALELRSADWRTILRGPHIAQARMVLQHLIDLPIRVFDKPTPAYKDTPGVLWGDPRKGKWVAAAKPEGLTVGLVQLGTSPTGFEAICSMEMPEIRVLAPAA
jgi:site-specific DNA recombinase